MIILGTKAETLSSLKEVLRKGKVLPLMYFTVREWECSCDEIWRKVTDTLMDDTLIVRSSALNEDGQLESQAGKYDSVLHVSGKDNFIKAVNQVIESFDENDQDNQVLIQPMLDDVMLSGVAFTLDPNTNGNYYVINYDQTGSTSSITSGTGKETKLFYSFKKTKDKLTSEMELICDCLEELEELFGKNNLDVEFAITNEGLLYIFQVRSLVIHNNEIDESLSYAEQAVALKRIEDKVIRDNQPKLFLHGKKTIFGVMPDWNPAEIIGIRPNPLALSLYREIITDNVWAYQRDNYGYKNLRSFPLMVDFCGLPYIDVRVSFNSFIPKELDANLSEKLANYYLERLTEDPTKHDKVEFDIVFSCYTLDLPERIEVLKEYGFSNKEIKAITDSLKGLTNNITDNNQGLWKKDYAKIGILEERYEQILDSDMDKVSKVYWLLEDCKRYGTLPFAGIARAGFIAVQILKSFVEKKIINEEEYQMFMNELDTVSSAMSTDFSNMSKTAFIKKYGHLRPGTYDINSKRYDDAPDIYFNWDSVDEVESKDNVSKFRLSLDQLRKLQMILNEHGLSEDLLGIFDFIKTAIEGREYAKFIFTQNLSMAIKLFEEITKEEGFSKEESAYANINIIKELYSSSNDVNQVISNSIKKGKENYRITKGLTLPPIILESKNVYSFHYPDTQPNYITLKRITGEVCFLDSDNNNYEIKDKIILIPSADPGYDWIFSRDIKGFITKYGGANSHMAIRAGELGIPAIIGTGEMQFDLLKRAKLIEIDALAKRVDVLK